MQWLINEFKAFKVDVSQMINKATDDWAKAQIDAAEKIQKLEGEVRAMKARAGKNNKNPGHDDK